MLQAIWKHFTKFLIGWLFFYGAAHASLDGDPITGDLQSLFFPGENQFTTSTAVVGTGIEFEFIGDLFDNTFGLLYTWRITADVDADRLILRQSVDIPFVAGIGGVTYTANFVGYIGDLTWVESPAVPLSASVLSSNGISLLTFDGRNAKISVPGLQFYFGINGPSTISQSLVVQLAPVPEVSANQLLAIGLTAMLIWNVVGRSGRLRLRDTIDA